MVLFVVGIVVVVVLSLWGFRALSRPRSAAEEAHFETYRIVDLGIGLPVAARVHR